MKALSLIFLYFLSFAAWASPNCLKQPPMSYAPAVELAAPAVVNVHKDGHTLGSGVIVDQHGYILTNYHVIQHVSQLMVSLLDGRSAHATLIGADPETDMAVLKVTLKKLPVIRFADSDEARVGDVVLAIGNPFGLGQTVTQGIISAIGRNTVGLNSLENYIQTDAAINPGSSGGALINTQGRMLGLNTGIYTHSGGYQGVGFAIPAAIVRNVMRQIIKTGSVKRGWLGIEVTSLNLELAEQLGLSQASGVVVQSVLEHSPAYQAGIRKGDVIVDANHQRIRTAQGFLNYIAQRSPGDKISLFIWHNHQRKALQVTLLERPQQSTLVKQQGDHGFYVPDDR